MACFSAILRNIDDRRVDGSQPPAEAAPVATRDRLTGLGGRELFLDRLEHCAKRSSRTGERYAGDVLRPRRFQARQRRVRSRRRRPRAGRGRGATPHARAPVRHRRAIRWRRVRDPGGGRCRRARRCRDRATHRARARATDRVAAGRRDDWSQHRRCHVGRRRGDRGLVARARRHRDVRGEAGRQGAGRALRPRSRSPSERAPRARGRSRSRSIAASSNCATAPSHHS